MQRYEDGRGYVNRHYGSNRRWLLKALREVARSIGRLTDDLRPDQLAERTPIDEWSIAELLGYLRAAEREDLAAIRRVLRHDGAPIEERRAYLAPLEHDFAGEAQTTDLLWEFVSLREETVWLLRESEYEWDHTGVHPYRGAVALSELVHEMNERDLDVMWRITRVRDALALQPGRRARRR